MLLAVWRALAGRSNCAASHAQKWLLLLAAFVLIHSGWMTAQPLFAGMLLVMLLIGAALQFAPPQLAVRALAYGVLIAALLNLAIGWLQFFDAEGPFHPFFNQQGKAGVAFGNVRQPNQFATLMAMGLAAVWWLAHALNWRTSIVVALTALLVSGSLISGSRTGVLELLLLALATALWRGTSARRDVRIVFMLLPLFYLVEWAALRGLAFAFDWPMVAGVERFAETVGASRRSLWHNVAILIANAPLAGYGAYELGYAHFMHDFANAGFRGRHMELIDNAHNIVLHAWVELGLFGMLLAVLPFVAGTVRAKPWAERDHSRQMAWLMLGVLVLHSGLEYPLHYMHFWLPFCLCLAVVFTREPVVPATSKRDTRITPADVLPVFAVVLLLCAAYAAWDYDRVSQAYNGPHRRTPAPGVNPVEVAQQSWLFKPYAQFAHWMTQEVTVENAAESVAPLKQLLHFSAEPRVLERLITALRLSGQHDEAQMYLQRFAAAWPQEHAAFAAKQAAN
jgi:O-antigen ligase